LTYAAHDVILNWIRHEYSYFKQRFFIKAKATGLKIAAARFTGAIIAKFMV
jgi:hypothetical protein